jgi:hypothetical protein
VPRSSTAPLPGRVWSSIRAGSCIIDHLASQQQSLSVRGGNKFSRTFLNFPAGWKQR